MKKKRKEILSFTKLFKFGGAEWSVVDFIALKFLSICLSLCLSVSLFFFFLGKLNYFIWIRNLLGHFCLLKKEILVFIGLRKNQGFSSTWSTLRKKFRLESGKKLRSIYQDLPKSMIIDTPWRYSLKSGSRSILKHLIGIFNLYLLYIYFF